MVIDGKPEHWPKMVENNPVETEQDAIKVLAHVRRLIVSFRASELGGSGHLDWRHAHAQSDHLVNVVGGLIADCVATNKAYESEVKDVSPLRDKITELKEQLAESKRPFSAQMEMQNRRIIALTAELDALKMHHAREVLRELTELKAQP